MLTFGGGTSMYKEKLMENKKMIFLMLFIIYASSIGYSIGFINQYSNYNFSICKMDLILMILNPNYIGTFLTIFPAYLAMHMTKYDFNTNLILRYKDKRIIWLRQNMHIIINSFIVMCSVVLFDFIFGAIKGIITYNWDLEDSMFFKRTHGITVQGKQAFVIFSTIIIGALVISIISILCNLIYWITNSQIISSFIVIAYCLWNSCNPLFVLNLFSKVRLREMDFITGDKFIFDVIILSLIIIAFIFSSIIIIRKKEFLNNTRG